ncbi:MAG: glycosyltransferase family 2 protein, partial [Chitinophaga rupis]
MTVAEQPLVSCLMPTYNRRWFIPRAIAYFLRQDYSNKELIIIDDGEDCIRDLVPVDKPGIRYYRLDTKINLGAKLNRACRLAKGGILVNWDDDDWYAPWRLRYQVDSLLRAGAEVCGINQLLYYDLRSQSGFLYSYPADQRVWLLGSSLCFTRARWEGGVFAEIDVGMDGLFVWATRSERVLPLSDNRFAVHMIHDRNVSPKKTEGLWWHSHSVEEIRAIMGNDYVFYKDGLVEAGRKKIVN